jgi:hypothetical protein
MKTTIKAKSAGLILASMIVAATPAAAQWRGPAVWGPRLGPLHGPAWRPGPWPGPGWAWRPGYWSGGVWYNGWWVPAVVAGAGVGVEAGGSLASSSSARLRPLAREQDRQRLPVGIVSSRSGQSRAQASRTAREPRPMRARACRLRAFGGPPRPTSNARPRIDDRT